MADCPHADIRFCPLYLALHDAELVGLGCDDGRLGGLEGCAVARGLDYAPAVERLRARAPRLVAEAAFFEEAAAARAQRLRNMRAAGLQ